MRQIKSMIRDFQNNFSYIFGKKTFLGKGEAIIIDEPEHGNLGDQAIAFAENQFLVNYVSVQDVEHLIESKAISEIKSMKKNIRKEELVFFHGGGNFGTLYLKYERIRRVAVSKLSVNKMILFPQSISFEDSKFGQKQLKKSKKIYSQNKNFILTAREPKSYELMKKCFPDNKVILTPDIVLSLNLTEQYRGNNRNGVMTMLREDIEQKLDKTQFEKIIKELTDKYEVTISDTHIGKEKDSGITYENRQHYLEIKWDEIAQHEVVLTDRLHGMIFSYITGTPCVVLANNNHKIEETYKHWLNEVDYIRFIENPTVENILDAINDLKQIEPHYIDLSDKFQPLIEAIKRRNTNE